jgi:predicted DNA-binding ribbon-helix-helix protein
MTQTVKFEDRTWASLATMADDQDTTIAELIEQAARRLLIGTVPSPQPTRMETLAESRKKHRAALTARVLRLRKDGGTVASIAAVIGYSTSYVSKILCENGARTQEHTTHQKETA